MPGATGAVCEVRKKRQNECLPWSDPLNTLYLKDFQEIPGEGRGNSKKNITKGGNPHRSTKNATEKNKKFSQKMSSSFCLFLRRFIFVFFLYFFYLEKKFRGCNVFFFYVF